MAENLDKSSHKVNFVSPLKWKRYNWMKLGKISKFTTKESAAYNLMVIIHNSKANLCQHVGNGIKIGSV